MLSYGHWFARHVHTCAGHQVSSNREEFCWSYLEWKFRTWLHDWLNCAERKISQAFQPQKKNHHSHHWKQSSCVHWQFVKFQYQKSHWECESNSDIETPDRQVAPVDTIRRWQFENKPPGVGRLTEFGSLSIDTRQSFSWVQDKQYVHVCQHKRIICHFNLETIIKAVAGYNIFFQPTIWAQTATCFFPRVFLNMSDLALDRLPEWVVNGLLVKVYWRKTN